MRKSRLRWFQFGHVQRRLRNEPVRRELIQVEGKKESRGRPKIKLI